MLRTEFLREGAISNTMLKHTENGMRQGADSPDEQGRGYRHI